jgi:hypothetical protein
LGVLVTQPTERFWDKSIFGEESDFGKKKYSILVEKKLRFWFVCDSQGKKVTDFGSVSRTVVNLCFLQLFLIF